MGKFTGVAYEPHPVTPERKAELRAKGLKILDARFKPEESAEEPVDLSKLKVDELREVLTDRGIEFDAALKKPELLALLLAAEAE